MIILIGDENRASCSVGRIDIIYIVNKPYAILFVAASMQILSIL